MAARLGRARPVRRDGPGQGHRGVPRSARAAEGRAGAMSSRADRVQERLSEQGFDALIVTHLVNIRWLTGFTGTNAVAVVGADGRRSFLTDFRYVERAEDEVSGFEQRRGGRDLLADAAGELEGRVGFEDEHLAVRTWQRLTDAAGEFELVGAGRLLEDLRAVKEP